MKAAGGLSEGFPFRRRGRLRFVRSFLSWGITRGNSLFWVFLSPRLLSISSLCRDASGSSGSFTRFARLPLIFPIPIQVLSVPERRVSDLKRLPPYPSDRLESLCHDQTNSNGYRLCPRQWDGHGQDGGCNYHLGGLLPITVVELLEGGVLSLGDEGPDLVRDNDLQNSSGPGFRVLVPLLRLLLARLARG